jgi:hypothetical protein
MPTNDQFLMTPRILTRDGMLVSTVVDLLTHEFTMLEEAESLRRIFQPKRLGAPPGYHSFRCVAGALFALWKQCSYRFRQGAMPDGIEVTATGEGKQEFLNAPPH